jgi:hypothetical protein
MMGAAVKKKVRQHSQTAIIAKEEENKIIVSGSWSCQKLS